MDFTVDVEMFQNGAQNMFFRTVNDGSRDVTVLVDADGKAIQVDILGEYTNVLFTVANNGTEIDTITDDDTYSREGVINACGGAAVNVTVDYAGASVFLLVMGTHIQYCNGDDTTTTPSVPGWPIVEIWADEQCTVRPSGVISEVYAKVKQTFGMNGERTWGQDQDLRIFTPTTADPNGDYAIIWYIN